MDTTKRKLASGSGSGSGISDDGRHQPLVLELNEVEDVTTYMSSSQPFILRSGVSHWPALTKWVGAEGKRYLSSLHGKQHVEVAIPSSSRDVTGRYTGDVREAHSMTVLFDDFLTGNVNHPDCGPYPGQVLERKNRANMYLAQCSLYSSSPEAPAMLPKLSEKAQASATPRKILAYQPLPTTTMHALSLTHSCPLTHSLTHSSNHPSTQPNPFPLSYSRP